MNIVIIGGGGHAGSVIEALKSSHTHINTGDIVIMDDRFPTGSERHGCLVSELVPEMAKIPAFVAIGDNHQRELWSKDSEFKFCNVFHESAVAPNVIVNRGIFFGANSYVGPGTKVGKFCIINTGAILEHDSEIGDFSHLCPGVVTGGRVKIGHHTTIGLGAMIRDGITIGNNCIIGMGAVVTKDVPDNTTAWGNPAKHVRGIKSA